MNLAFIGKYKIYFPNWGHENFLMSFFKKSYQWVLWVFKFGTQSHSKSISTYNAWLGSSSCFLHHFLQMHIQLFQHYLPKDRLYYWSFYLCWKSIIWIQVLLFLESLFCSFSLILFTYFDVNTLYFGNCSFIISVEARWFGDPTLFSSRLFCLFYFLCIFI